ncbi:MAG: FAD-dependent oxidoreductase [Clostridia bacterium]|nr:FAD-dependent oxidoreductase [Clostridia bacterium]
MKQSRGITVENIRVPVTADDAQIIDIARRKLSSLPFIGDATELDVYKKSIDARRKSDITLVCSVRATVSFSRAVNESKLASYGIKLAAADAVKAVYGTEKMTSSPVVVGFGPAGMFAALFLAENGYEPVVLERGGSVGDRVAAVEKFVSDGDLDTDCNIQFGAGGAGTFSDGKLTTRISDPYVQTVLNTFAEMGASPDAMKRAKPHVGTDVLRRIVENFDARITSLGGKIRYRTKVTEVREGAVVANGETVPYSSLILAVGHSSRELYSSLFGSGFEMVAKPFSCGVRIEHLTRDIDRAMYGDESLSELLGHAEYSLSHRQGERGVYTFCMCPGGEVVAASSEAGGVVTNGMSNSRRDGVNSNAAIAVSVLPSDFGDDPMSAVEFQRKLERSAFTCGGGNYYAPCQTVGRFMSGSAGMDLCRVSPSYRGGLVTPSDLGKIFPDFITSMLRIGIDRFGKKIDGFSSSDAPLTGVESRTSSPVRILRREDLTATRFSSVYPCGEGAGYAGGIVSAAVDGIRCALAVMARYAPVR